MGIFSEDTKTSISLYIENLSNYEEIEWYQFQQLTESILMQPNGAREAIEAIRKKLKHGTSQQKLRVLEVLKLLMENSDQRFHRELIGNEKMKERFVLIIDSPAEDIKVRKFLVMLLGTWAEKFKDEEGMCVLQQLYERGRATFQQGSSSIQQRSTAATSDPKSPMFDRYGGLLGSQINEGKKVPPPPVCNSPTNHHFNQHHNDIPPPNDISTRRHHQNSTSSTSSATFDFEKAKPKIIQEVALATQSANNLVNALRLINTAQDDWETDMRRDRTIQQAHQRCEEEKKNIVRYARLVEDEEWIGTLLAANEELLRALDMHDIMLTGQIPSDLPSSPQYRISNHEPLALLASPSDEYEDDDISSRLSGLQVTAGDTHVPRDIDGQPLEDPFADPV